MATGYETAEEMRAAFDEGDLDKFKSILKESGRTRTYSPDRTAYNNKRTGFNIMAHVLYQVIDKEPEKLEFFEALLPYCRNVDTPFRAGGGTGEFYGSKVTALIYAVALDCGKNIKTKIKCIELLLKHGASTDTLSPNLADVRGVRRPVPPLLLAHEPEVLKLLIKGGADLTYSTLAGCNAVANYILQYFPDPHFTSRKSFLKDCKKYLNGIKALLKEGASPNAIPSGDQGNEDISPLMAVSSLKKYIHRTYLSSNKYSAILWKTPEQKEFYLKELDKYLLELTDILLEAGADPNYKNGMGDDIVTVCGSYVLLKKFLDMGCSIMNRNKAGVSVFSNAVIDSVYLGEFEEEDRMAIIEEYLNRGGSPDDEITSMEHKSALFYSVIKDNLKNNSGSLTKLLIERGADVNFRDKRGDTPLLNCLASMSAGRPGGMLQSAKMLTEAGADVRAVNKSGSTCLHYWAGKAASVARVSGFNAVLGERESRYMELLDYLVEQGADVNAQNNLGLTPAGVLVNEIAAPHRLPRCMPYLERLIEYGADVVRLKDGDGHTVVDMILVKKYQKTVTALAEHHQELKRLDLELEEVYVR